MKIAIHNENTGFQPRWINYCQKNGISYKLVNAYNTDIVRILEDCDILMWHNKHYDYRDVLFSKQLLFSLEQAGKKVFPDFNTTWHFDDKVGQKYLLEAIHAPIVPSYVFYTKKEAVAWIEQTMFPKVFKLRGGAGSTNVSLVKNRQRAKKIVRKAFGKGIKTFQWRKAIIELWRKYKDKQLSFFDFVKYSVINTFVVGNYQKLQPRAFGYVYFQDFIPNNKFDIRICVVDGKAFGIKRMCRDNDFRASGSGHLIYDKSQIDERCVNIALETSQKLKAQSIAYDFVFDGDNNPLIVEISYGYSVSAYDKCEGYWDSDMNWHNGDHFDFCGWMVESAIRDLNQ